MKKEHKLKTRSEFFREVISGKKRFEIRRNDRNFEVGDTLILEEIDFNKEYTGAVLYADILYKLEIMKANEWLQCLGYESYPIVVMSISDPYNIRV